MNHLKYTLIIFLAMTIVHPAAKNWIDLLNHFPHRLADLSPENFPELDK